MMQPNSFVNSPTEFLFDSSGKYTPSTTEKTLKEVLLAIIGSEADSSKTVDELMKQLVNEGMTGRVNEIFSYHFSLNEALAAFRYWLNAMPENKKVHTNCHDFTPLQIRFLKQHYTAEHKFIYTPATYPKVQ